jgi:hypothetical protein
MILKEPFGKEDILGNNGPDGKLEGVYPDWFFDEVIDIGGNTHIYDVIARVAGNNDGVLIYHGKLVGNGVKKTEAAFLTQVDVNNEKGDSRLHAPAIGYRLADVGEGHDVSPTVKSFNNFGDCFADRRVVVNYDQIQFP